MASAAGSASRKPQPIAGSRPHLARGAPPLLLGLGFLALLAWSFGRWADPVIDFGAELYVPWRLAEGDVLYRDIAYRNGPLAPYLNALWFRIFGTSVATLVGSNLGVLALLGALLYRFFLRTCGRPAAAAAVATFFAGFGFAQYVSIPNYNWVTPYQHSQTYGVAFGLATTVALGRYLDDRRIVWLALSGGCLGLVALTKLELQLPAFAAAATAALLIRATERPDLRRGILLVGTFGIAFALPVVTAFSMLASALGSEAAWGGLLGNWRYLDGLDADAFYRAGLGVDQPASNAWQALRMAGALCALVALAVLAEWGLARVRRPRTVSTVLWLGVFAALLLLPVPWLQLPRALPLASAALVVAFAIGALRGGPGSPQAARFAALLLFAVFSLALLAKMILHTRIHHYGFALAMPASVLCVATLVGLLPRWSRARGGPGTPALAVGTAAVAAALLSLLGISQGYFAPKVLAVGAGRDAIHIEPVRGRVVTEALRQLDTRAAADATLVALPEGAGLNYWLRRRSSSRFFLFIPAEFAAVGGESTMLEDLRRQPPDWIALVDRPHQEFGVGPFGSEGNGRAILAWVQTRYERVARIGREPFQGGLGIVLLHRRPEAPSGLSLR